MTGRAWSRGLNRLVELHAVQDDQAARTRRLPLIAVATAGFLVVLKLTGAWITGSLALGSAAIDSLVDLFISAANYLVLRQSAVPPDADHAYGHGKFENLAALGQGLFLLAAGIGLVVAGTRRLISGEVPQETGLGVAIFAVGLIASFIVSRLMRRGAKRLESPALHADSVHYFTDFVVNGTGIAALLVVRWTGWAPADPLVALGIALFIFRSAAQLILGALADLSDRGLPAEELGRIQAVIATYPEVAGVHDLKTRRSGGQRFIEFHLEIPRDTSFTDAHDLTVKVLRAVEHEFPRSKVFVHGDPV